jgi:hypothetical protein
MVVEEDKVSRPQFQMKEINQEIKEEDEEEEK